MACCYLRRQWTDYNQGSAWWGRGLREVAEDIIRHEIDIYEIELPRAGGYGDEKCEEEC